ncbi:MAG: InlB B-repeat-containing protein, partial [Peptoniphilus grossensis]
IKDIVKANSIIDQEEVVSRNRHYDARNYRHIPGWKLASDPQQQLFYDVDEATGEFKGINGTGLDEIFFYYEDVRVIDVPKNDPVPDGYVRITFKADKGGTFTDKNGNPKTELYYDVIKGLKSDLLVVPQELQEGADKEEGKYYITPDAGKKFTKWDEKPLLNDNTIIDKNYEFTAYFDWSDVKIETLVVTESFKDQDGNWINNFIPTEEQLKAQVKKLDKNGKEVAFPTGTEITIKDSADDIYEKLRELDKDDSTELVREVKIKAEIKFSDNSKQEIEIPVKVYKNVYEALTSGAMPKVLKDATEADGDLINVTGEYVKVTVNPTGKPGEKDSKIYYVNKNAWVNIPEINLTEDEKKELGFTHWSADIDAQNENGVYDFNKRHKFTEDTVISPGFEKDVVEQTDPDKKPPVPESYVKVIVKTTDKATDDTAFKKTFWVNSTKEVTIDVTNPTGKTVQADPTKVGAVGYTMKFSKWQSEEDTPRTWEDKIVGKFEKETTIVAKYSVTPEEVKDQVPKTDPVHTPEGKTPTVDEIKDKITPPDGKTIKNVTIVEEPDVTNPGNTTVKVIVEYDDGSSVGTNDNPVEIKVEVHKNIIPAGPNGEKPEDALDNYVKVIFTAGTGGKLEGTLTGNFIYYVSPEVEVDMTEVARDNKKSPDTGYFVNGEKWNNKDNKALKGKFTDDETVFEFVFDKSTDIVEKTSDDVKKPDGYVTVTFRADANGKLEGDKTEKIYYVNPKAGIKLVELADGQTAGEKQLAVPKTIADKNYVFEKWYEAIDKNNPITNNLEYVARFVKDGVTLTYEAGGAEGKVPEAVTVAQGTSVRLASAAGLTKKDAKFAGWKIGKDIYQAGDLVTLEESKTAVAQWTNDENIIPYDPSDPITRPDKTYVRVTFEADDGLKLTESKAYYVKKDANITLAELAKPAYEEKTGYKFKEWDKEDTLTIAGDTVVKALSTKLDNVIPETKEDGTQNDKPQGYKEVVFVADANGKLEGVTRFFVNPDEYVTINPPKAVGNTGYEFGSWDKDSKIPTVYKDEVTTITASFNQIKDVIPKTKDDDTEKPKGYKTVTFVIEGEGGKIVDGETTTYFVDPNRQVTIQPPTTNADIGYKFNAWDKNTTTPTSYAVNTTVKGSFSKLEDIIPATDDNPKPDGYVTVTFDKGEHGTKIEGQRIYYVNPKANISLGNEKIVKPTVSPETGWKANG